MTSSLIRHFSSTRIIIAFAPLNLAPRSVPLIGKAAQQPHLQLNFNRCSARANTRPVTRAATRRHTNTQPASSTTFFCRSAATTTRTTNMTLSPDQRLGGALESAAAADHAAARPPPSFDVDRPTAETPVWLAHRYDPRLPASGPPTAAVRDHHDDDSDNNGSSSKDQLENRYSGEEDWVRDSARASGALATEATAATAGRTQQQQQQKQHPLRVLVLYGTLRPAGLSKLLAYEVARVAEALGADVRTYDPHGLPVRDPELEGHHKVQELRQLVGWSEAHVWVGAELHGNLCSVLKNQIDWIPVGSGPGLWPTEGKTVAVYQVNGGAQSFNTVNTLRLIARWLRMPCIVTQGCVPQAWAEFDSNGRMKDTSLRDRIVDVCEELYKSALVQRELVDHITDRYSARKKQALEQASMSAEEKDAAKIAAALKAKANN
jgi:arsenical resistance protein ArsH